MRRAICAGSFDPVTKGHIDIFQRAAGMFDELLVGVFNNIRKKPFLTVDERIEALEGATSHIPNLKVISFDGLLADYMIKNDVRYIVRGLRSITYYEYEQGSAQIIKATHSEFDTVFLLCNPEYSYISSSVVRELLTFGGDITRWVPPSVVEVIDKKRKREAQQI